MQTKKPKHLMIYQCSFKSFRNVDFTQLFQVLPAQQLRVKHFPHISYALFLHKCVLILPSINFEFKHIFSPEHGHPHPKKNLFCKVLCLNMKSSKAFTGRYFGPFQLDICDYWVHEVYKGLVFRPQCFYTEASSLLCWKVSSS